MITASPLFINIQQRNPQGLLVRVIGVSPMRSNARRSWVKPSSFEAGDVVFR
nr:MAG TPA: hypothetical protein [Caudoviricetes sp.]